MNNKLIVFLFTYFIFNSCTPQIKVENNNLDVIVPESVTMSIIKTGIEVTIINNSNTTYIIDPYSFNSKVTIFENQKEIYPYRQKHSGYYDRDDDECKKTIILAKPKSKIVTKLYIYAIDYYDFQHEKNYEIKSSFIFNKSTMNGCSNYVDSLIQRGYKFPDIKKSVTSKLFLN